MKKRVLAVMLAVMLMVSLMPIAVLAADEPTSGACGENLTWSFDESTGVLTISGTGEMEDYTDVEATPWFALKEQVKRLVLEEGVTSVGDYAFGTDETDSYGYPLAYYFFDTVQVPDSLVRVGEYALACGEIGDITIHDGITYEDCALSNIVVLRLEDGMTTVPLEVRGRASVLDVPVSVTDMPVYWATYPRYVTAFYRGTEEQWCNIRFWYAPNSFDVYEDYSETTYYVEYDNVFKNPDIDIECWGFSVADCGDDYYLDYDGVLHLFNESKIAEGKYGDSVTDIMIEQPGVPGWSWTIPPFYEEIGVGKSFSAYKKMEQITLHDGIRYVVDSVFEGCDSLRAIYFAGAEADVSEYSLKSLKERLPDVKFYFEHPAHEWDDGKVASDVSCVVNGEMVYICALCGMTRSEAISAVGHKAEAVKGKAATCTAAGLTDGSKCSVCGEVLKKQETIPALEHEFSDGKCTVCGAEDPDYVAPTPVQNPFTDVADDAWYAAPVLWAFSNNVTGGTSATTFGPDDGCTRAQVVTFLWAANGKPEPKSMNNPFKDVADNAWYLKPVLWAVEQGITGGVAEGKFGPEQTCTRAQIATFLYAAAGKPEVSGKSIFKDVKDADWFAKPIIWAAQNEVTGGIGDGKFGPNNTCTRAQVVTFLYKVYGNK